MLKSGVVCGHMVAHEVSKLSYMYAIWKQDVNDGSSNDDQPLSPTVVWDIAARRRQHMGCIAALYIAHNTCHKEKRACILLTLELLWAVK